MQMRNFALANAVHTRDLSLLGGKIFLNEEIGLM